MRSFAGLFFLLLTITAFGQGPGPYALVPRPVRLEPRVGSFKLNPSTPIRLPDGQPALRALADTLIGRISRAGGPRLTVTAGSSGNPVVFTLLQDTLLGPEGYRLDIRPDRMTIEAARPAGLFYALQSLYQLLPAAVFGGTLTAPADDWSVPACLIEDRPRYAYRGLHLDVARHFMPISFVKKYIDLMAFHKLNTFHWHLTDDQGWRIEIKKYPRLTQIGSRRKETIIGHYYESEPQQFDGQPYGGFYTQEEIREVVRYAASRYITIVPEIEMPGHALAALAAYPEYGCTGGPYEVATKWGIFTDIFCPYEKTFTFLQAILTEVIDLFPGPYIHIGGDEAPKKTWKESAYVQALIKQLKLKNEQELQRHFVARIDRWVSQRGRSIIGWDEILEGSGARRLSAGATVMSWRGVQGGVTAARTGYRAIMTPSTHVYFDHYQSDRAQEPIAFGGFTPLEKTYAYEPTPADLPPAVQKRIIGAQGNLWTEYVRTPDAAEYAVWPRAAALAEVVWTPREGRNWPDFLNRLEPHLARLDRLNVRYARSLYDILAEPLPQSDGSLRVSLTAKFPGSEIRYTTDDTAPDTRSPLYTASLKLSQTTTVKAIAVRNGRVVGKVQAWTFPVSKATGRAPQPAQPLNQPREAAAAWLTDGQYGTVVGYPAEMRGVAGIRGRDLDLTLDLGTVQAVQQVRLGLVRATIAGVLLPSGVEVAVSEDGKAFRTVLTQPMDPRQRGRKEIVRQTLAFTPVRARYLRIVARSIGTVPAGLPIAGKPAVLMVDEIEVN